MEVNEPEVTKWFRLASCYCSSGEGIFVLPDKGQHCCYKWDKDFIQRAKCCTDLSADSSIYSCSTHSYLNLSSLNAYDSKTILYTDLGGKERKYICPFMTQLSLDSATRIGIRYIILSYIFEK